MRLGVARERQLYFARDIAAGVAAAAATLGWSVSVVDDSRGEADCDVVLAIGNPSLYPDLARRPKAARRVLWYSEPLYSALPGVAGLHEKLPTGRLLDVAAAIVPGLGRGARFRKWREDAAIVREPLANLVQLRGAVPAFDRIVMDSHGRAASARRAGLQVDVVPLGYDSAYAGPLRADAAREVDVLFFGRYLRRFSRRQAAVEKLLSELERRNTTMTVVTDDLFGTERRRVLEKVRVVVDLHRMPGNVSWHRFILAAAAGAAVVTERIENPAPLERGVHYLESSAEQMADTVVGLLSDEDRRQRLVAAAQALLATEMSMTKILPRVVGSPGSRSGREQ